MSGKDPKNPVIYGVFTTSRYVFACMSKAGGAFIFQPVGPVDRRI